MAKTLRDNISDKLVNAFLTNKIISPIPNKFTSGILQDLADRISKSCKPNELRKSMPILDLEHFQMINNF